MRVKSDPTRSCANPLSERRNLSGKRQCNPAVALPMRNGERGLEVVVAAAIEGANEGAGDGQDDAKTPNGRMDGRGRARRTSEWAMNVRCPFVLRSISSGWRIEGGERERDAVLRCPTNRPIDREEGNRCL